MRFFRIAIWFFVAAAFAESIAIAQPTTAPASQPSSTLDPSIVDSFLAMNETDACTMIEQTLAAGLQRDAERLATARLRKSSNELHLIFDSAILLHSRFDSLGADTAFEMLISRAPDSAFGKIARLAIQLDHHQHVIDDLKELHADFEQSNPPDPMILWLYCIECRQNNANRIGVDGFTELASLWKPGPALMHQTFANLLDEMDRSAEALPHRMAAISMEPASWSYDGLANTLSRLRKFSEADKAHAVACKYAPHNSHMLCNWAVNDSLWGKYESAEKKFALALNEHPTWPLTHWHHGMNLERMNRLPEALAEFQQAIDAMPRTPAAYYRAATILDQLNRHDEAVALRTKADALNGNAGGPSTAPADSPSTSPSDE